VNPLHWVAERLSGPYHYALAGGYTALACFAVVYVLRFACLAILNTPLPNP
jgi:hypothetical protein